MNCLTVSHFQIMYVLCDAIKCIAFIKFSVNQTLKKHKSVYTLVTSLLFVACILLLQLVMTKTRNFQITYVFNNLKRL